MLKQAQTMSQNSLVQAIRANPTKAIVIGGGALILAPAVLSLLKPVAKATIKTGVVIYEKTKTTIAETGEVIGDIIAEAKAEVNAERRQQAALPAITNLEQPATDN